MMQKDTDRTALISHKVSDADVKRMGRLRTVDDICYLTYSGSEIGFFYTGSHLEAELVSDVMSAMLTLKARLAVVVGEDETPFRRMALNPGEQTVVIYDREEYAAWKGIPAAEIPEKIGVRMIKFSEAAFGSLGIKRLLAEPEAVFTALPERKHRIEYIGDSITCGYGVEGVLEKDVFTTAQENPQKSFSLQSAGRLDADYQLVSWSGIGILTDYIPPEVDEPLCDVLIHELYPYTDKKLDERLKLTLETWDFSAFIPEVVVLNIGTNDASYTREKEDREAWYAEEMKQFIRSIHEKNETAKIVFCYGIMDHTLCPVIEKLVGELRGEGCSYLDYLELPEQLESDGIGADFHPSAITQAKAGKIVADHIRQLMGW